MRAIRLIVVAAMLMGSPLAARAQTQSDQAELAQGTAAFDKGDYAGGLRLAEDVLSRSPQDQNALYFSAVCNFQMGNADAARGRLERVVKLAGNYFNAWELMVQVTQVQGDLARRDEAIARLKIAINTAIDPDVRQRVDFVRDHIKVGGRAIAGVDYFDRSGSDFTRYQWNFGDPRSDPDHGLLLRTDAQTTETWAMTALLPPDKQLFHLDLVDRGPNGEDQVAVYQYYVGEPDYDTVRADVMKILRGEEKPLSGEPGSLAGVLK